MVSAAAKSLVGPDPTYYPIVDKMGEGSLQRLIAELLRPLIAEVLAELGVEAFVGADQFIYYQQYAPTESVAPDVYVMPGFDQGIEVDCWKTWETNVAPSFALEIVSRNNPRKDTERSPLRYEALGAKELVIFDPRADQKRDGIRWLVYRRLAKRGFVRVETTNADRVYSKSLRLWLRVVGEGAGTRVRLARGPEGDTLIPTAGEALEAAEAEVARLRAEIERLRR
jgi:Uma2 family endonuclease